MHNFDGLSRWLSRVYGNTWRRVRSLLGLQFLGFVDYGPMDIVVASFFVQFFLDLRRFEWEIRGLLGIYGGAWWLRCWRSFWVLYIKVLRRFLWVDFLWNLVRNFRNPRWRLQTLLNLLPPWSTLAVAILTVFDIGKAASVSAFKVDNTSRFEQCSG